MAKSLSLALFVLSASSCAPIDHLPADQVAANGVRNSRISSVAGVIESRSFRSEVLNTDVIYHVVLPQPSVQNTSDRYPVVYWLHGSGGYPPGVLEMLGSRFQDAMAEGRMPPAIIVFPDGFAGTMWANAADGSRSVEDMVVQELVPHIDATFRTDAKSGARLIEGASMGGYGAARLGMLYPEIFGAISMINPGPMQPVLDPKNAPIVGQAGAIATLENVFGSDVRDFERRSPWTIAQTFADRNCRNTRIRMILGEDDPITPTNLKFSQLLNKLGIDHDVEFVADAGHNPRAMLENLGVEYWDFIAEALAKGSTERSACS